MKTQSEKSQESSHLLSRVCHKVAVVGDTGSGKTSLIFRFSRGRMPTLDERSLTVIEVDVMDITRNGKQFQLSIYDTSGREEYARLRGLTYNHCDVVLICLALDSPQSVHNVINEWVPEVRHLAHNMPFILVGTKSDLRVKGEGRAGDYITQKQGRSLAKRVGAAKYMECSALSEANSDQKEVKRVFGRALREATGDTSCCYCCCC
ncbi:ras-like GTP-binding protein rhoA [Aplysia californica]|uniref:Ras-like GTP-binding protein rhoA n=1 Tax=Aplysia californica TaxID=6500 RepID=A0ABM0JD37_APLCA|nr:ras-like GTP-binding protein rhoA [Aplysia californica]